MVTRLDNAELQQYLETAVRDGRFPSVDAAIEEAVRQWKWEMEHLPELDAELEERLQRADEQIARGEVMTVAELREKLGRELGIKL